MKADGARETGAQLKELSLKGSHQNCRVWLRLDNDDGLELLTRLFVHQASPWNRRLLDGISGAAHVAQNYGPPWPPAPAVPVFRGGHTDTFLKHAIEV